MDLGLRFQFRRLADLLAAQAAVAGGTGHAGTTGALRETVVQRFLRPHLPQTIEIRSGVIVDSKGGRSKQQDLILVDNRFPVISVGSETEAVVIAESVLATVEVKSFLSAAELAGCLESSKVTKSLYRSGQHQYEKGGLGFGVAALPIHTYVFAFDGANLGTLVEQISTQCAADGSYVPDATCVVRKGVITRSPQRPTIKASDRDRDNPLVKGSMTLPKIGEVDIKYIPLEKDALFSFYSRLKDDVIPLKLVHYDLDPYFDDSELQ
jgi:hypothetical protein